MPLENVVEQLEEYIRLLTNLVKEGEQIFSEAGGSTVGDVERAGESKHLDHLWYTAEQYWFECLPYAAALRKEKRITKREIRAAYAMEGMVSSKQAGAYDVADSIFKGAYVGSAHYFPTEHVAGLVSALRYILASEYASRHK
jgi:hypothetical protein